MKSIHRGRKGKNIIAPQVHEIKSLRQTLQVQLLEHLEPPDLLADGHELVVPQGQDLQLLQPADGGGDPAQLVVRKVQDL